MAAVVAVAVVALAWAILPVAMLVKTVVLDKEGIPLAEQRLTYSSRRLEEDKTLSDYGLRQGMTLRLTSHLRGGACNNPTCAQDLTLVDAVAVCCKSRVFECGVSACSMLHNMQIDCYGRKLF